MTTKPCPRRHRSDESRPTEFGELVTADHMVISESDEGTDGQRAALVVLDRGTDWVQCYPLPNKSRDEAIKAFTHVEGESAVCSCFTVTTHQSCVLPQTPWDGCMNAPLQDARPPTALLNAQFVPC